jgi:hypothetical protein
MACPVRMRVEYSRRWCTSRCRSPLSCVPRSFRPSSDLARRVGPDGASNAARGFHTSSSALEPVNEVCQIQREPLGLRPGRYAGRSTSSRLPALCSDREEDDRDHSKESSCSGSWIVQHGVISTCLQTGPMSAQAGFRPLLSRPKKWLPPIPARRGRSGC